MPPSAPHSVRSRGIAAEPEPPGGAAACVEMIAVARGAAGQRGGQRRGPALEIAAGAEHAVRIDHDAGVAIGQMLAADRRP